MRWNGANLLAAICLCLGVSSLRSTLFADERGYHQKGKVVAIHVEKHTDYAPIMPVDSKGRRGGGGGEAFIHIHQLYEVQADDSIYRLRGGERPTMSVGDVIEFRIDGSIARVLAQHKVKKYRVESVALKPE